MKAFRGVFLQIRRQADLGSGERHAFCGLNLTLFLSSLPLSGRHHVMGTPAKA
jgi:hypothetical protein